MKKRHTADKLAAGVRQARRSLPAAALDSSREPAAVLPEPPVSRFARQSDQSPPASLDRPWANLHPERIWPD